MEVRYRMTPHDRREALRVGLPRLSLLWSLFWVGVPLSLIVGLLLVLWSTGYSATWPPRGPFPWHALAGMSGLFGSVILSLLASALTMFRLTANQTVRITPQCLLVRTFLGVNPFHWKHVADVLSTDEHVCFYLNTPIAVVVPIRAFPNKEQALAFAEQAGLNWRRATGRKDPPTFNPARVWLPPPTVARSQQPDDGAYH